jgi:hypothetical protein
MLHCGKVGDPEILLNSEAEKDLIVPMRAD